MSEQEQEGNLNEEGGTRANVQPSTPASQPSTPDITALMARLDALEKQNKALQSGKDKRWNEVMPVIEKVASVLGIDESKVLEAQKQAVLNDLVAERMGKPQPSMGTGTTQAQAAHVDVQTIAANCGLDLNADAAFVSSLMGETDPEKVELKALRYVRSKSGQPTPTSANAAAPTGGKVTQASGADLVGEYTEKMKAARGNKALAKQIKEDYRKRGCPVDQVYFGV